MKGREYSTKLKEYRDKIITFSVGVGDSSKRAEDAMFEAKKHKKGKFYNIGTSEPGGTDAYSIDAQVEHVRKIRDAASAQGNPVYEKIIYENLEALLRDQQTGLLNRLGMGEAVSKNPHQNYVYVVIDGNNMHALNEALGYAEVDPKLAASGRGISRAEQFILNKLRLYAGDRREHAKGAANVEKRHTKKERRNQKESDLVGIISGRPHGTGDEFVVMIPMKYNADTAKSIARNILKRIYEAQITALEKQEENVASYVS